MTDHLADHSITTTTPPHSSSSSSPMQSSPPAAPIPTTPPMLTPLPRPEIMQQRSTSLSAPLTIRGDIMGKLVAPLHPTLPLESDNNNHRGTHLPLYMLSVGNRVP
ncbi:hypothetical protein GmHk_08G023571 [Glycine max]|nr:hypothetical protein GmHk_08G023571 [Glycine max]